MSLADTGEDPSKERWSVAVHGSFVLAFEDTKL